MQIAAVPVKIDIIFGSGTTSTFLRQIPDTSSDPNAASFTLGFPPNTFVDPGSGGDPPDGRDVNGILNMLSAWTRWSNAGGPIFYDPTFSASVGGYPQFSMLSNASTPGQFWISTVDNNTSDPDTGGANWLAFPAAAAAVVNSFNTRTGAVTLTSADVVSALSTGALAVAKLAVAPAGTILGNPTGAGATPTYNPPAAYGIVQATFAQFRNQQTSGTGSGESLSGNSQRHLNTTIFNSISGASLSGNQVTLPAGTYEVTALACSQSVSSITNYGHRVRLHDDTNNAFIVSGLNNAYAGGANNCVVEAQLQGIFTCSGTIQVSLFSWVTAGCTGGPALNSGDPEVYVDLYLRKVA